MSWWYSFLLKKSPFLFCSADRCACKVKKNNKIDDEKCRVHTKLWFKDFLHKFFDPLCTCPSKERCEKSRKESAKL